MNTPDTIDTFLDEALKDYAQVLSQQMGLILSGRHRLDIKTADKMLLDQAKASIKQFIKNRVKEAKGEVVKKCNATGKKSMCPNCNYPALFERAVGGTECIVCEYQMPF